MKISFKRGSLLIAAGAFLWATDALFRVGALSRLSAVQLVWVEHFLGILFLAPWIFISPSAKKAVFSLNRNQWLAAIGVGAGASAIALLWFTQSFSFLNPSVAILLQKLQPVMASIMAVLFLKERPSRKIKLYGPIALLAGLWLSFPDLNFSFLFDPANLHAKGVFLALGAAFLWAAGTVLGRTLLHGIPASVGTFWRFIFGLATLTLLEPYAFQLLSDPTLNIQTWLSILYLALVTGLLAMLLYYRGLSLTPAHQATYLELVFPVGAVILNALFLGLSLSGVEILAGSILLFSIAQISR